MRICICGHRESVHDPDPLDGQTPGCVQCICETFELWDEDLDDCDPSCAECLPALAGEDEPAEEDWGQ